MRATKCDRCGKYIDESEESLPYIKYAKSLTNSSYVRKSICQECYSSFEDWFLEPSHKEEGA